MTLLTGGVHGPGGCIVQGVHGPGGCMVPGGVAWSQEGVHSPRGA